MTVQWAWQADPGPGRIDEGFLEALRAHVDPLIQARREDYIAFLCDILRYPTVSGAVDRQGERRYREAMDECLARVEQEATRLGLAWREYDGVAAVAEWPGRRGQYHSLGIAAHLDVVPPGGAWRHAAFSGDVVDGEIWGRGTQDDKGPVAMALAAIDVLKRMGLEPTADLRLLLGTLEETDDWPDMDLLLQHEAPPEFTLVPDGAFPVVVGEKGIITVEWHASWTPQVGDGCRFLALAGGERHNVVPGRATLWVACRPNEVDALRARLDALPTPAEVRPARKPPPTAGNDPCFEVVFRGKAAHGAFPQHGHNAVLDALTAVEVLFAGRGAGSFARFLLATCSASDGSGLGLQQEHENMGGTTLNLGVAEFGTGQGHVQVNIRFPLGLHLEAVKEAARQAARQADEDLRVEYMTRGRPHDAIFISPEDHPRLIHTLQAAYETATGREPTLATLAGTTYAKIFPLAIPFGTQDESAGEPILAHQVDERITVERHLENIRIYVIALALLAFDHDRVQEAIGYRRAEASRQSPS